MRSSARPRIAATSSTLAGSARYTLDAPPHPPRDSTGHPRRLSATTLTIKARGGYSRSRWHPLRRGVDPHRFPRRRGPYSHLLPHRRGDQEPRHVNRRTACSSRAIMLRCPGGRRCFRTNAWGVTAERPFSAHDRFVEAIVSPRTSKLRRAIVRGGAHARLAENSRGSHRRLARGGVRRRRMGRRPRSARHLPLSLLVRGGPAPPARSGRYIRRTAQVWARLSRPTLHGGARWSERPRSYDVSAASSAARSAGTPAAIKGSRACSTLPQWRWVALTATPSGKFWPVAIIWGCCRRGSPRRSCPSSNHRCCQMRCSSRGGSR